MRRPPGFAGSRALRPCWASKSARRLVDCITSIDAVAGNRHTQALQSVARYPPVRRLLEDRDQARHLVSMCGPAAASHGSRLGPLPARPAAWMPRFAVFLQAVGQGGRTSRAAGSPDAVGLSERHDAVAGSGDLTTAMSTGRKTAGSADDAGNPSSMRADVVFCPAHRGSCWRSRMVLGWGSAVRQDRAGWTVLTWSSRTLPTAPRRISGENSPLVDNHCQ